MIPSLNSVISYAQFGSSSSSPRLTELDTYKLPGYLHFLTVSSAVTLLSCHSVSTIFSPFFFCFELCKEQ